MFGSTFLCGLLCLFLVFDVGESCSCRWGDHPQNMFCGSDFAIKATVTSAIEDMEPTNKPFRMRSIYVNFNVNVHEVFKGPNLSGEIEIATPSDSSLCGTTLAKNKTYLITGRVNQGRLSTTLCNWITPWEQLSEKMLQNLGSGFGSCKCAVTLCDYENASCREEGNEYCKMLGNGMYNSEVTRNCLCGGGAGDGVCGWQSEGCGPSVMWDKPTPPAPIEEEMAEEP